MRICSEGLGRAQGGYEMRGLPSPVDEFGYRIVVWARLSSDCGVKDQILWNQVVLNLFYLVARLPATNWSQNICHTLCGSSRSRKYHHIA